MHIQKGQIVKNLMPDVVVSILECKKIGERISIKYLNLATNIKSNKLLTQQEVALLEVVSEEGSFNFLGDPTRFTLFAEAQRISSAYQFDPLFAVNCSIVDPLPHQVEAVYKFLLPLPKIRFLLADDTGAGKTIMAGLLIKELILRGFIERILIITPGGLTQQWQADEMLLKFNLEFKLVNRSIFSSEPTVFQNTSRIVTSIDFISREDILNVASNSHWDLIIFDEAHKLSAYDYGTKQYLSLRYRAAQILAQQSEHLLLLTATPHRGRNDTFKRLLQLLDEDIFATEDLAANRVREIEHNGINKFFIRRLKEDMKDWDGNPLYKERHTKTIAYELTAAEKDLYDAVTKYLTKRKEQANESRNIHVSLALTVMQRRLASSIFAIKNTLEKRYKALNAILTEVKKNPNIWHQRTKLENLEVNDLEQYDELNDSEKDSLETIMTDPKKFKLFTTAKNPNEIQEEAQEVKKLFEKADKLYKEQQDEKKLQELKRLLETHGVADKKEKLVIFTEHKDTLIYLEEKLKRSGGYGVATIHGSKNVDERRAAQVAFAKPDTHILIATDAAGEGINLQFCRLLINWDIPWNPNRLEQRMGRIHRYGQKQDVLVLNMVASNTKEGKVLERLLSKLDIIRDSLGDDRVYDVIQDVLADVNLDAITNAIFEGKHTAFTEILEANNDVLKEKFAKKIQENKTVLAHSTIDFKDARRFKENSDEQRLQPIYIRLFFEKAFQFLGGTVLNVRKSIFCIQKLPDTVIQILRKAYNIAPDTTKQIHFCFDKQDFLAYQNVADLGIVHYISPGYTVFDAVVKAIIAVCQEAMLKGTILVSPDDQQPYYAFFVRSQIVDNRNVKQNESIADERLLLVQQKENCTFALTSPAKFIDLQPPITFAKPIEPPTPLSNDEVIAWAYENITIQQLEQTENNVKEDTDARIFYLETAFNELIGNLQYDIGELQAKALLGDSKAQEKIDKKEEKLATLRDKKQQRLHDLTLMQQLSPKEPEILGCAYIVPLTALEYQGHFGMSRDDEAETIAMQTVMQYEIAQGWTPKDVSADNCGYDIASLSPEYLRRYIEVKGRSGNDGSIMLSENEMNRLAQLGNAAWLYIVTHCKTKPTLHRIQNPALQLEFEKKSKGFQYFLPMQNWIHKTNNV